MFRFSSKIFLVSGVFILLNFLFCIDEPVRQFVRVTVTINGAGTVSGLPSDTLVAIGDTVYLTAVPDSAVGYIFSGWKLGRFTSQNPLKISIKDNTEIIAYFVKKPGDMVLIQSMGKSFQMGSSTSFASDMESPVHTVSFCHDFFISSHEVTQAEYKEIMHEVPALCASSKNTGDSLPVFYVTWYDAVLYCNELSKKNGYDTVYTYSSVCTGGSSCPTVLENLKINYDRYGYRLPTEAEWEFACRAGTGTDYYWGNYPDAANNIDSFAWYSGNSAGISHPVAQKKPNAWGLFDMCGNVGEWVNDWLDTYQDTTVVDPVGPTHLSQELFERTYERPVRGGSYRLESLYLRSSVRKEHYATPASTTGPDIGFRVALGAFEASTFSPQKTVVDSLGFTVASTKTDLVNFIGTSKVKIVFVSAKKLLRSLYCLDFTGDGITVSKIGDDTPVYSPVISPDGRYVAYGSQSEGAVGPTVSTIRSLNPADTTAFRFNGYLPRFWVSPQTADTFVIFADGASMNNQASWYTEKTYRQRFQGGKLTGSSEIIANTGSYHGGLSSDGRFLATSFPKARLVDLELNDTNIFYFKAPYNGRDDDGQICNLSINPSKSVVDECMFLDFGYSGVSRLLKKPYGFHSVIFINNSNLYNPEQVRRWYEKPEGYDQWDFVEWSNHPGFAVATARTADFVKNSIYAIDCNDSLYLRLADGETVRDVWMWIDPSEASETPETYPHFGQYDIPIQTGGQLELAKKLRLFWHYRNELECIIIGSSPAYNGIDPSKISMRTLNMAAPAMILSITTSIAKDYILPHASSKLKVIVAELIPYLMSWDTHRIIPRMTGLYDSKGYQEDMGNNFYKQGIPAEIITKINHYNQDQWLGHDTAGFYYNKIQGNGWGEPVVQGKDYSFTDSVVQSQLSGLKEMIDSATSKGIYVLLVNLPQNPLYKDMEMMGFWGPTYETYHNVVAYINSLAEKNSHLRFYDAGNDGDHDFTDDEALDANHLNYKGAARMGVKIDSILQQMIP